MSITDMSMLELSASIKAKKVSAVEVLEATFDIIDEKEEDLNAFVSLNYEQALKQAENVDNMIAAGQEVGALAGIPYATKDNVFVKGQHAGASSEALSGFIADYNADVTESLMNAGAICIGRTNMDELAMGSSTVTSAYEKTRNPWLLTATPGGSSGGSAAAVAAKEAVFALGSDTGGSIRQPASFCGVIGFKPTKNMISNKGIIPLAEDFDQVGMLTRNVADCAKLLDIMSNGRTDASLSLAAPIKGRRIAIVKEYMKDVAPDVMRNFDKVLSHYIKNGAVVEELSLPDTDKALQAYHVLGPMQIADLPKWLDENGFDYNINNFGDEAKRRIIIGQYFKEKGSNYINAANNVRNLLESEFDSVFERFDALLTPCTRNTAFNFNKTPESAVEMYKNDLLLAAANLTGICAVSVPSGFDKSGLPTSVQLMANKGSDSLLLNIANNYFSDNQISL